MEAAIRHLTSDNGADAKTQDPVRTEALLRLLRRGREGLLLLHEARLFASEVGRPSWDFAVEIKLLRDQGLTQNDLRWLVGMRYLAHCTEITSVGDSRRLFQPDAELNFSERTCFSLTEEGLVFLSTLFGTAPPAAAEPPPLLVTEELISDLVPSWDHDRQELRFAGQLVKQFKAPAMNQVIILSAFEEEGWPARIDDPLPPHVEQDPKRRLHDTINALNRSHKNALVRFLGDGSGQGIRWETFIGGRQSRF